MDLISNSKIVKYPFHNDDEDVYCTFDQISRYYLHLRTDANVTIIVEIPIDEICTISDVARRKYSIDKPHVEDEIENVMRAYINLYRSLGISILGWSIETDGPK